MNKFVKVIGIILIILIVLGITFYTIDKNKAKKGEKPIFCIHTETYKDGGTKVYYGLGYKVIAFNKLEGYNKIKIGTWNMKYEDFESEYKLYNERSLEIIGFNIETSITINGGEAIDIINILENLNYNQDPCDGISKYIIKTEDGTTYNIKSDCNGVTKNGKQAEISNEMLKILEDIIDYTTNHF